MSFSRKTFTSIFGEISSDFDIYTLEDIDSNEKRSIISGPFGSNISSKYFTEYGVPVIRGNNLTEDNTKFIDEGFVFVSREKANELNTYARVDDLIFTAAGTIGQVGMIPENSKFKEYVISNKQLRVTLNLDKVNQFYVYYWFSSKLINKYIKQLNTGSTIPLINLSIIKGLPIPLPSKEIQDKIASVLITIDKKIQLNEKINKNLEQLIHTIFNYWFISFEKFNNSKFTQTVLGDIPEGWNCGVLRDLLTLTKNPIKATETNGLPYLPIDIIPMNSLGISELKSDEEANSSLITFDKNDILIGAMRVYFHRVVISPCLGVTRSTCFVLKPNKEEYLSYLLLLCNLDQTIQYAQNTSKGTTMPYAVWDNGLGDMDIIIPPENVLNEFHQLVFPIIEKIRDSYNEINKLQKLRDTLLPKLMSGEIDVSKINCDL